MSEPYDPKKPFNEQIKQIIKSTHPDDSIIQVKQIGKRFKVIMDPKFMGLFQRLSGTDGIGTKAKLHSDMRTFSNGAQDAVAMVFDDLIEYGFEPVELQDHILMQTEDNEAIFELTNSLKDLCIKNAWTAPWKTTYPVIITGGETAIINTLQGFEMGITATGYALPENILVPHADLGHELIGIASNGVHSNGYSFLRKQVLNDYKLEDEAPWDPRTTVGEELTKPTHIYLNTLRRILQKHREDISGLVHITGGGFTKLKELAPGNKNVKIIVHDYDHNDNKNFRRPLRLFKWLQQKYNISDESMYERFNNGVGYVVAVPMSARYDVLSDIRKDFDADAIGQIWPGSGSISIRSVYTGKEVLYPI